MEYIVLVNKAISEGILDTFGSVKDAQEAIAEIVNDEDSWLDPSQDEIGVYKLVGPLK